MLNNSTQPVAVAATVAKQKLKAGHKIREALGGFDVRGEAVEILSSPGVVPITLMDGAKLTRDIQPGEVITWDDVDLETNTALDLYLETVRPQADRCTEQDWLQGGTAQEARFG